MNLNKVKETTDLENGSFIQKEKPILIKNGCRDWQASKKWSAAFFSEVYGKVDVPVSNYKRDPYEAANLKPSMKISAYLNDALAIAQGKKTGSDNLYSAGWFFCDNHCELLNDINEPSYFADNWAEKVQKIIHFDTRSIIFGHPMVESPLHTDSFFVSTWIAEIKGQKRVRLVDPRHTAHVHNGFDVFDDNNLDQLAEAGVTVYDAVLSEGDILWMPPGWWHHVKNDSFTISLTTNFVDPYHFLPFEQQVRSTLIKPLLRLDQLRQSCSQAIINNERRHSQKTVEDANYIANEKLYLDHIDRVSSHTKTLINHLDGSRTGRAL